jgi:hypothetical protein
MSNQINYINYKIIDDNNYYQQKYLKYKIKYLNKKNIIYDVDNNLYGGIVALESVINNFIIFIINKITILLEKKEDVNYLEDINEDEQKQIDDVFPTEASHSNEENIIVYIVKFILCVVCHLLAYKDTLVNIFVSFLDYILQYIDNNININEFMIKLFNLIPCLTQFNDVLTHINLKFLFETLKNSITASFEKYKENIKSFLLIKNTNFKQYIRDIDVITKFNYMKNFKHTCSSKMTTLFNGIIDKVDKKMFDLKNPYKQFGGGYIIKIGCYQFTIEDIMKIYIYFKKFTSDQIRDFLANVEEASLKILFMIKYLINFVFKIIFTSNPKSYGYRALEIIDSIISITIALYYLNLDKVQEYILQILYYIMNKMNVSNKIIGYIIQFFSAFSTSQSCNM